MTPSK
jgi:hypothetical protein